MTKNTTGTPGVHLPWAGKMVHTQEVEETLSYFWRMSADNVRISQNTNVRTSVLNFVICAQDISTAQRASALLRDLASTHIGRVTLLILDTSSETPANVSTWVTLRSFPIISDIMRHSFEQITVLVSGTAVRASANIIQPLLKPDLPVYLWWLNDPPDDDLLLRRLADISSRVIVDSNSFFTPELGIRALSEFHRISPQCALSDINWGRITPWRQLVAQFFDMPDYKPYLSGIYNIEVEHAVIPGTDDGTEDQGNLLMNPNRALLLAGWLKKSFNWQFNGTDSSHHDPASGSHSWFMSRHTGYLQLTPTPDTDEPGDLGHSGQGSIAIRPRTQPGLEPGSLCLIRLNSVLDGQRVTFTINRERDAELVLTSVDMPEGTRSQRAVSMAAMQHTSVLLHDELEILGRDHLYEDALHEVFELLAE